MKKTFAARRVPRKIGQDEDEEGSSGDSSGQLGSGSALKRPASKPRKSSSLRAVYRASDDDGEEEETGDSTVFAPKRSNLSRVAVQRNALKRSTLLEAGASARALDDDEDRPNYSAASLQQLKDSTPTTPRDLTATDATNSDVDDVSKSTRELDLSSKFGSSLTRYQQASALPSAIPSAAEIAEKKARRARLAKEQAAEEFISLDPDDPGIDDDDEDLDDNVTRDERGRLILNPKDKYNQTESRLVRDDEDIMENFDEFTEADTQIALGRNAEAEAARRRKQDMAARIAEAEGATASDDDENDSDNSNASERERNAAFEAAQTRHGIAASASGPGTRSSNDANNRPRTPPKISPLPTLDGVIARLHSRLAEMQSARMQRLQEMEALQREKVRLAEEEVRIQRALRETADKFTQLRAEKGIDSSVPLPSNTPVGTPGALEISEDGATAGLGLGFPGSGSRAVSTDVESWNGGGLRPSGLGYGLAGRGLESLGSSAVGTPAPLQNEDGMDSG